MLKECSDGLLETELTVKAWFENLPYNSTDSDMVRCLEFHLSSELIFVCFTPQAVTTRYTCHFEISVIKEKGKS